MAFVSHRAEVEQALREQVASAMTQVGTVAAGHVADLAPVQTGNLRRSITSKLQSFDTVIIGTPVEYAPYVEFGHHQQPGRFVPAIGKRLVASYVPGKPFFRPGIEGNIDEYRAIIERALSG